MRSLPIIETKYLVEGVFFLLRPFTVVSNQTINGFASFVWHMPSLTELYQSLTKNKRKFLPWL
ncbi:hypothetical protein EB001_04715 [bacterium]|nr:hypothetical protein [bacterium]